jgi:DNA repair exonuclease SbcCD ATPase subunit
MNKLIIQKAKVKNFLSYGNEWQTIEFSEGLTLVQGINLDTGKSNGSGKSSVTEIIPFALFGKTIKDIPQTRMVNWNNRSGCSVKLYFTIGNDSYVFERGLKPNKFNVKCNGMDIVRTADIRVFQSQMEEEVIGMDFKTFKNLIYFSPNNTISILGAKKEQKRQFLESLFDLSEYSELLKIVNKKIGSLNDKLKEIDLTKVHTQQTIDMIQKSIDDTKEIDLSSYNKEIERVRITIEALEDNPIDDQPLVGYDDIKNKIKELRELQTTLSSRKSELEATIKHISKDIESSDTSEIEKKSIDLKQKIVNEYNAFVDKYPNFSKEKVIEDIDNTKRLIEPLKEENRHLSLELVEVQRRITTLEYCHKGYDDNIGVLRVKMDRDELLGQDICPTCKSSVDHNKLRRWYEEELTKEEHNKQINANVLYNLRSLEKCISNEINRLHDEISGCENDIKDMERNMELYDRDLEKIKALKESYKLLPDINKLKIELSDKKSRLEELISDLDKIIWKHDLNKEELESKEQHLEYLDILRKKIDSQHNELESLRKEMISLIKTKNDMAELKDQQKIDIEKKKSDIEEHKKRLISFDDEVKKSNKLLDHLNYIRVSLKDENVKQFAISALLPYLNQRANHYLSESGFPYIVDIDGWLDVIIRGMGTEDVGYNSLSGGESKAMDMAVQLACNDIAELQAKTSIGISMYDEILDTSLDADGVQRLMDIIKVKQRENGDCVLVITHRDEIKELEFDNHIMIEKKDGFSTIQTQ